MKQPHFRHEWKYPVDCFQMITLCRRLSALMRPDPHAGADGTYRVRSLYFDSAGDRAYLEKVNGMPYREKFRLRYYNDDLSFIRLEKKSKIDRLTEKEHAVLTSAQCRAVLAGDTAFLMREESPLLHEFYAKSKLFGLAPVSAVDYIRRSYVHPLADTRITFDCDIRTGIRPADFLNPAYASLPCDAAEDRPVCIMEIKYNEFLPGFLQDAVQTAFCRAEPFSKYEISRRLQ